MSAHSPTYPLGNSWVVCDRANDRLLTLNETAYRIWQDWEAGLDPGTISRRLADAYQLPAEQLLPDVLATIAQWQTAPTSAPPVADDGHLPTQYLLEESPAQMAAATRLDLRIQDAELRLHVDSEDMLALIEPLLAHLQADTAAPVEYHVESVDGDCRLRQGTRVIYQGPSRDLLAVNLLHEVNLAAYRDRDTLCALHASAVGQHGQCLLMPAVAGAGKSTLTAALLQTGLEYLSDDTVPITADGHLALALRPPLCLKQGSVPVLAERYPGLQDSRVYQRADQPVRYLPPPAAAADPSYQVGALVFPRYQAGADTRLEEIPVDDAFARLLEAGIFTHQPREPSRLAELLRWLGTLRCYQLHYDDLDAACARINDLFQTGRPSASPDPEPPYEVTQR